MEVAEPNPQQLCPSLLVADYCFLSRLKYVVLHVDSGAELGQELIVVIPI